MAKLLFLAGSAARQSTNKTLAVLAASMAKDAGAEVEFIDLKDYDMPIYCGDWEAEHGMPETTQALKQKFHECDGFFIASPEYNSAYTPLLKNIIDWMSRPSPTPLVPYKGKIAAIGSVSPGLLGGLRGLTPLRILLSNIGVHVIPTQIAVGGQNTFDDEGGLAQDHHIKLMQSMIDELVFTANRHADA